MGAVEAVAAEIPEGYRFKVNMKPTYDGWHAVIWHDMPDPWQQWNGEGPDAAGALRKALDGLRRDTGDG